MNRAPYARPVPPPRPTEVVPTLRERRRRDTSAEIAAVAAELFLRRGAAATTVADVAAAAGISTRTFHRYFPTKAEALAPALRAGLVAYLDAVAAIPAPAPVEELVDSLVDALVGTVTGPGAGHDAELVRLVVATPELLSVWLRMHEECAVGLAPLLAAHLADERDPTDLRLLATVVVAANRLAVEDWVGGRGAVRANLHRGLRHLARLVTTPPA